MAGEKFDLSGLRIAMEHMLHYQEMGLEEAAFWFVMYAVGLVSMHLGDERAEKVIELAKCELEREATTQRNRH